MTYEPDDRELGLDWGEPEHVESGNNATSQPTMSRHDELRKLLAAAELPWTFDFDARPTELVMYYGNYQIKTVDGGLGPVSEVEAPITLIVAAVNALPALLDELDALRVKADAAEAVMPTMFDEIYALRKVAEAAQGVVAKHPEWHVLSDEHGGLCACLTSLAKLEGEDA